MRLEETKFYPCLKFPSSLFRSFIIIGMDNEQILEEALDFAGEILRNDFSGHGYDHIERVYRNALTILREEKADSFLVLLSCALHDVDDIKLFPDDHDFKNARSFLTEHQVGEETIKKVLTIIEEVSFKGKDTKTPASIEGKIVQDADRLDAIGAIGIARAFAFGGSHHRPLYDEKLKIKKEMSEKEYRAHKGSTIAHFYEKLLLLKDMMSTEAGKRMAKERHEFLLLFLDEFAKETGHGREQD